MNGKLVEAINTTKKLERFGYLSRFKRNVDDPPHEIRVLQGLIAIDGNPLITWDTFTYFWLPQYESDSVLFSEWILQTKE